MLMNGLFCRCLMNPWLVSLTTVWRIELPSLPPMVNAKPLTESGFSNLDPVGMFRLLLVMENHQSRPRMNMRYVRPPQLT